MRGVRRVAVVMAFLFLGASVMFAVKVNQMGRAVSNSRNLLDEPRHPVTEPMWQNARAVAGKAAPSFQLKEAGGKDMSLREVLRKGPAVVVFTKDDCPCSMEAQPLFNHLAKGYSGKATFLGVMDSKGVGASKYQDDFKVPYPMLIADDEGAIFKSFRAKRSVYTTLIDKDGIVVKQWPGYSRAMIVELDEALAKATGGKSLQPDTSMAPEKMNSGCAFPLGASDE